MGTADETPAGRERLAAALSKRFRLDEKIVRRFLASGRRIRAKGGLEEGDASKLAHELEGMGAIVAVEGNTPQGSNPFSSLSSGLSAARPDAARDGVVMDALENVESLTISSLDGAVVETGGAEDALSRPVALPQGTAPPRPSGQRASTPPPRDPNAPPRPSGQRASTPPPRDTKPTTAPPKPPVETKPTTAPPKPTTAPPRATTMPPRPKTPAPSGDIVPPKVEFRAATLPPVRPPTPPATPAPTAPRDPFAPPVEVIDQPIELAYPVPRPSKRVAAEPSPEPAPEPTPLPPIRVSASRPAMGSGPHAARPSVERPLETSEVAEPVSTPVLPPRPAPAPPDPTARQRLRLVAGLILGVGIGFVPAQMYASSAEGALDQMKTELTREPPPSTDAAYDLLVERYAATRAAMVRTKARIEIATAVIWVIGATGLSLVALRLMPKGSR